MTVEYLTSLLVPDFVSGICLAWCCFCTCGGPKGDNITLPCLKTREDFTTLLKFGSKTAYGAGQDGHFRGRVHESGSCDLILQGLKTTDAGKYMADVYDNSGVISSNSYDVHVKVSLTGRKGEELMFDDLPREAESVTHLTNADCTEVWRRGQGVLTDRLTHKNDRLSIESFSSSDAGTYRVLNSTGGILVTLTLTELGPMERGGTKVPSASSITRVSWSAALPFLIGLFVGFL
ncbi:uncharacterized protein LOC131535477 [Onychostoma macrolepis]|uniref:uncharacterized protein LOC131535477 n=1 Tax=Onychostoma macrolepis TaxID=369639 RepID=UPI00272D9237|nr:uncharacterized protein LOC131535477 [Onychostoma macrolepis]